VAVTAVSAALADLPAGRGGPGQRLAVRLDEIRRCELTRDLNMTPLFYGDGLEAVARA